MACTHPNEQIVVTRTTVEQYEPNTAGELRFAGESDWPDEVIWCLECDDKTLADQGFRTTDHLFLRPEDD